MTQHTVGPWHCGCVECKAFQARVRRKQARLERVAAEMRQKNARVVKIRATVTQRRGNGHFYPKQSERMEQYESLEK